MIIHDDKQNGLDCSLNIIIESGISNVLMDILGKRIAGYISF